MKTSFIACFLIIFFSILYAPECISQILGSPLRVSGKDLLDSNNLPFIIKAINLNDYMENPYTPWGAIWYQQSFSRVVSWLHTEDDYSRIKTMGFNTVRLNICPSHIDSIPNLQRIKQHISWAKQNNLYLILAYFSPPGDTAYKGYYSEKGFYLNQSNQNKYLQHWYNLMQLCRDSGYTHVMYEFLNEPQISYDTNDNDPKFSPYWRRSIYLNLMNTLLVYLNSKINDGNRVVIIDGLSYARADYRGFNYLINNINYKNIVYSFHYYMDDFAFRGCNYDPTNKYALYKGYTEVNPGYDTIQFNFTVSDLKGETRPDLSFSTFDQKGRIKIKYFEIRSNTNENIISMDLLNKQIQGPTHGEYILDNYRQYFLNFNGLWGSSVNSNIYMENNNALIISNTVKQDTNVNLVNNWANMSYSDSSWNNPFMLSDSKIYTFKTVIDGDSLDDNGGFEIAFKKNNADSITLFSRSIHNLTWGNTNPSNIEKMLSSHTDRINATFNIMKNISARFKVPIFLGEFGIPIPERDPATFTYFRNIMDNILQSGFGWAYFDYREPHKNKSSDSSLITFGLFSGIDDTQPNTTVCKIINGIGNTTSDILGYPHPYYYNRQLIDTLVRILNGSFTPVCDYVNINDKNNSIPDKFVLEQNFPNPFNPSTIIRYALPSESSVKVKIYNLIGQQVQIIVNEIQTAGYHEINYNAALLASGVYFYSIDAYSNGGKQSYFSTKKMILMK